MATTTDKRKAVAALAAARNGRGSAARWLKRGAAVVLALFLVAVPLLWAFGFFSPPQAVAEIERAVDQQVAEYERVARGEIPFGSSPSARPMFEKMREVPREYRDQVGQQMGRLWEARERAELASYFALPADKRQAELDRRIKAEEARRKQWQAEREKRDQSRGAGRSQAANGPPGGGRGPGGGGPGGVGPGGGRGPGGGPPRGGTQDSWNERSKQRIDRSTPEQRARQTEYRRAMDERRTQLGLPTGGRRG